MHRTTTELECRREIIRAFIAWWWDLDEEEALRWYPLHCELVRDLGHLDEALEGRRYVQP